MVFYYHSQQPGQLKALYKQNRYLKQACRKIWSIQRDELEVWLPGQKYGRASWYIRDDGIPIN